MDMETTGSENRLRFVRPFREWRIRTKLISLTLFLVLLPLLIVSRLSMDQFSRALRTAAEEDLQHLVTNLYAMCMAQQDMVRTRLQSNLNVAREVLYAQGERIQTVPEEKIYWDAVNQFTNERFGVFTPLWRIGKTPLVRNSRIPEKVQALVGGNFTILQRIEGDGLLRISTNIGEKDSGSLVGSFIPRDSPVNQALLAGNTYEGRALVGNRWYMSAYEPILDAEGRTIGALSVGVMEESSRSLKNEIKGIKVGKTGYVYAMDSDGTLRVHPAKEGENILDSRDSSGFEYIKAMIEAVKRIGDGEVGTIRYPWMNPELGETEPRQKITKFIYFKPWDWIIAAGTYEEEIYQSLYQTERFITIVVLVSIALVLALTLTLSNVLTGPIRDLTGATTKMLSGDLSQRVQIHGADEFGILGNSFNRMAAQIQGYTANLEEMVEERTHELRDSREKYRDLSRFLNSILESATEYAIIALDFYGKIIEFNTGAERLFGWKKEEVLNKENIGITILAEDRNRGIQEEMSKRTRSEGVCEVEMSRLRKDGLSFPAHSIVTAMKDPADKVTGFVEIVRDLTRRRTLERELRETKEFLENILESSVDGIVTTDLKGHITYMNLGMEILLDYRREELLGTHISSLYVRGIDEARDLMNRLRTMERTQNYEMQVKAKSGEVLSIVTSASLLRDGEGNLIGTAGIFKDITEQKRLEAKLKETQFHLVEALKMRALGELVSGVAHELNNPLMASQTILHVILNNLHEDCPNLERLQLIGKCNDRIEKIVDHLREFSRQTKPHFQEIDINQPIENALLITGQQLLDHNVTIVRNLTAGLPGVLADSSQLEQVFLNLISNSRDAMDDVEGKKELTIRTHLTNEDGGRWVTISVEDTGVGIPQNVLDKVFEPFFTTKAVGKGTGLGLSLCFGIVEAHGGRLQIESQVGKGTRVRVILPVAQT